MAKKRSSEELELYTPEQLEAVEKHIEKHFGKIFDVFEQNNPTMIKTDIAVIEPTREKPYFTLITRGMGAHVMNVPAELKKNKLERAELVICMPADWDPDGDKDKDMWVLDLLSHLSRLPIREKAWLGWGHSVDYGKPFTEGTELCAVILINSMFGKESCFCKLPDGDEVNFYQVIPLYREEVDLKNDRCADALMNAFGDDLSPVVYLDRRTAVTEHYAEIIDTAAEHTSKIANKGLDLFDICGANHLAAYFRWCMEHKLLDEEFADFMAEELEQLRSGEMDCRKFILNYMNGELTTDILNEEGREFSAIYYDFYGSLNESSYPSDVDSMALDYFGEEKYNCEEFHDEAYLFVPYGEEYYAAISKYINRSYRKFKKRKREEQTT